MRNHELFAVALLASSVQAFWGNGHILVSRGAEAILQEEAPEALEAALKILKPLQSSHSSQTSDESQHSFTECANFADNLKDLPDKAGMWQYNWHFTDAPYLDEGGSVDDFNFTPHVEDSVHALFALTKFLKGETLTSKEALYTQTIAQNYPDYDDQMSVALRLVIHYEGDIVQPLHNVSRVDSHYPKGDLGGNMEPVPASPDGVSNLHSIWDSVIYEFTGYPVMPLSDDDWDTLTTNSSTIRGSFPVEDKRIMTGRYDDWAKESYDLAVNFAYHNFPDNDTVPDKDYLSAATPVIKSQIALGSRRLAETMKYIFGDSKWNLFLQ